MLKKIISSTISQILAKVITAIITIFFLSLITNYFTLELFWIYNKVFNYIFIFAFLVDLWLYAISVKEIWENKEKTQYIFSNILSLRLFSAIFVIFLSVTVASFLPWYNENIVLFAIFIASIFTFFSLINSSLLALMQAHMKMEFSLLSVVMNKIFVLLASFFVIKYLFPIDYHELKSNDIIETQLKTTFLVIIAIVTLWMFINMLLNYFYARTITKIKLGFDLVYIKKIFLKSLPYAIALFLSVVYTKIDIVLISLMEKGLIADRSIALYSLPLKIMDVFMIIASFFMNSLLPWLSENYKNKEISKIKNIVQNAFKVMFSFWIIIIFFGLILKDNIVKIIANSQYLEQTNLNMFTSSDAFWIIFFMILFFYLGIIFSYLLIATNNQKKLLKISIILTIVNIVWNIVLIPYYSFVWAWIATVLTQIVFLFLVYIESRKIIKFDIPYMFIIYVFLLWFLSYLALNFLIVSFSINIYFDVLYACFIFILYIFSIYILEKVKYLHNS